MKPTCKLEDELFKSVDSKTPEYIKNSNLIDIKNKNEFSFVLKKEHLQKYDEATNPQGLGLYDWFEGYAKEAQVSTAGIRGPQNILYPQDTRFPINLVGIVLATVAKALVAIEKQKDGNVKLVGREVRYNSDLFLEAIARIQAQLGIKTLVPVDKKTIPIWLASFLCFKLDLLGGEYITSSHGISVKNATKDLNSQGSQYLPEESAEFVGKIREIFEETQKNGNYEIKFSSASNPLIDEALMAKINDGVDLYVEYLQSGVAKDANINAIQGLENKVIIENVGGCAYQTLNRVLKSLKIDDKFDWSNIDEDPFFHSIGKYDHDSKGNKCFYDYSVDATVVAKKQDGTSFFPVIESLHYDEKLKTYPIGTVVLITDPDHDRLTIAQIEDEKQIDTIHQVGIDYVKLDEGRILTVYTANQAFLMLMDFQAKQLKSQGIFENHPRFMIKTTASALSWDEWANANDVKVINVPVGFKEIANIMKKVEAKMAVIASDSEAIQNKHSDETGLLQAFSPRNDEIIITDVFGKEINLGVNPRLIFAGEESGGMIMGCEDLIKSQSGRLAIAMREKSATEAIIVASALASQLEKSQKTLSQNLLEVFKANNIKGQFDTRADISYYNESEPDINKLKQEKVAGEEKRTLNDLFYLSLAMGVKESIIDLAQVKEVLTDALGLDFSNLSSIKFVGDGTYMQFDDKFIEIRPSGTDAKTKSYAAGLNKPQLELYSQKMGNFSGARTNLHKKLISDEFYDNSKSLAMKYYLEFVERE